MPFAVAERDGVLTLTLDTPGSPINVFTTATAHQLADVLAGVTAANTRAIVFATAKANSFINGVGLLLAHASQSYDDIARASAPPWTAYRAVREAPVPTIAVVQGNCFGCGVEFALNCDYRIATDTCETRFYMTELNDYLFIPLFGSTWNLPAAVGLEHAIDLLLWGESWSAATAHARGLIDEVAAHEERAARTEAFVARVVAGRQPSRRIGRVAWSPREDALLARARRRIGALPPAYHEVYERGLELLRDGARQTRGFLDHQSQELRYSAESALSAHGKAAYSFFYVRQMASERAAGRAVAGAPARLTVASSDDAEARAFVGELRGRELAESVWCANGDAADFRLVVGRRGATQPRDVPVALSPAARPQRGITLCAPAHRCGSRLVELATTPHGGAEGGDGVARLARTLQRLGFEVARTTPTDRFVSTRLLTAYFAPLTRAVARGIDAAHVNGALRAAGFVRRPPDLLAAMEREGVLAELGAEMDVAPATLAPLVGALEMRDAADAPAAGAIVDGLCLSLLAAMATVRARREVRDPSVADLIARELLDFPRHLCSLGTWLKRHRVARALEGGAAAHALAGEAAVEAAREFVAGGREFYR